MKRKPKAYKRSVRKQQVIKQLAIWRENGFATEATSYKLARALGLEPSTKFSQLLNEMVAENLLTVVERDRAGRFTTRFYSLVGHYHGLFAKRVIKVNKRGENVGQLELSL